MIQIDKWPCIIVSNQRSGSTALATILAKQYSARCFIEPAEQRVGLTDFLTEFSTFRIDNSKKWLVKCIVDRPRIYKPYQILLKNPNVFKIRLFRANTAAQIASSYIANITGMWFGNQLFGVKEKRKVSLDELSALPIDQNILNRCMTAVTNNNKLLLNSNFVYDLTIRYESLNLDVNEWRKSELPKNYYTIINLAEEYLKSNDHPLNFEIL